MVITVIAAVLTIAVLIAAGVVVRRSTAIVPEDWGAVVVDRHGFIRRTLPAGVHRLRPGLDRIEFMFETKTRLGQGTVENVSTADAIPLRLTWSGAYVLNPALITDKVSQRLRGLPKAERGLQRQVEIALRRLVGAYTLEELFRGAVRERIERQLTDVVAARLRPTGVVLDGLNLQTLELPPEVASALNQARAIEALDAAIRRSDAATREVVTGAHKLDELLAWSEYLPPYGRYALAARRS